MHQEQGHQLRKDGATTQQDQPAQMRVSGLGGEQGRIHEGGFYRSRFRQGVRQYVAGYADGFSHQPLRNKSQMMRVK